MKYTAGLIRIQPDLSTTYATVRPSDEPDGRAHAADDRALQQEDPRRSPAR